jgi:hypothetical protein
MDVPEREVLSQSAELAGGEGFTYEGNAAAYYLAALLAETGAPGISDRIVYKVAVQQRDFGEPLDDVIVDFKDPAGELARLSLQVKRTLTISNAASNADFRDIVHDSWASLRKSDFRDQVDRYGVAVGTVATAKARSLTTLCELARESSATTHFEARFAPGGNAAPDVRVVRDAVISLLKDAKGSDCTAEEVHRFLAHFVLIEFEFLQEGAADPPAAITMIRGALASSESEKAPLLWSRLVELARASAGKSGVFDRSRLVRSIAPLARLSGAHSLRQDLDIIGDIAKAHVESIQDDVGGARISRDALAAELDPKLAKFRIVQVRGLPGSGKSVVLRNRVERALSIGPALFLKGDQLEGKSWRSFATSHGLSSAHLEDLLVEVGATGSPILFVDAVDRIEREHQPILLEVLRSILNSPLLNNWHVVLTLRDTGIEPTRNWLGGTIDAAGVGTVDVTQLDRDEAEKLAVVKPHLRPLLFGPPQVSEIVRRPFFAKILSQGYAGDAEAETFAPQSEVDLIENWWVRGGYNAAGRDALERQRAIVELAGARARKLSQPIALKQLSPSGVSMIPQFVEDGILQQVRVGHTVRFSHDIFFEWAFFHTLADRGEEWLEEIKACGEPPAVARVVELLSQSEFARKEIWADQLRRVAQSNMRSQWTRAWLLGPVAASDFEDDEDQFATVAFAEDFRFLKKALVWFQAEKTSPNAAVLASDLAADQRLRYADLLGWPSDFSAWRRLIVFLLRRIADIPPRLFPDAVAVFEVWQNAMGAIANPLSQAILTQCEAWLADIAQFNHSKGQSTDTADWKSIDGLGDFREQITQLILRAASVEPSFTTTYLRHVIDGEEIRDKRFKEVISFSPTLAQSHPTLLVELTLKHLREELPDDKVARHDEEARIASERRRRALAKPEAERDQIDKLAIEGIFSRIGFDAFSYQDFETLSIERDMQNFWPVSPLREPFHSLFRSSPADALALLTALCNHAMTAWGQLHRHIRDSRGTPVPLEIAFPWGRQIFWGGDREYLWFRNMWAPKALGCGFMALEEWCFAELERGRDADDLIRQIVEGNACIAILGVAAMIAMHGDSISDVTVPLVTSQRLLAADHNRFIKDLTEGSASFIGLDGNANKVDIEIIATANAREVRRKQLSTLLQRHFMMGGESIAKTVRAAVLDFPNALPFQLEEHRGLSAAITDLTQQAAEYAELVEPGNYKAYRTEVPDEVAIVHVSPSASDPDRKAKAEEAKLRLEEGNLWAWAAKAFETGAPGDAFTLSSARALAQQLDTPTLFSAEEEDLGTRRGAVAGAAAMILRFRDGATSESLAWARETVSKAAEAPEQHDQFWSSGSIIPWHHATFAARGLAADLAAGTAKGNAAENLLRLVAHPLEIVSLAAIDEAGRLWDHDARLSWAAFCLAFSLCHISPRPRGSRRPSDPIHSTRETEAAIPSVLAFYHSDQPWPDLALPPPAFIRMPKSEANDLRYIPILDHGDDGGEDDEKLIAGEQFTEVWAEPASLWHYQLADKILPLLPVERIVAGTMRDSLLRFASGLLLWTSSKNEPPGKKPGRRDRTDSSLFEWTHELGSMLGRIAGLISEPEAANLFLAPIAALHGEACWSLLTPFANVYICRYLLDAPTVPVGAVQVLDTVLTRFLAPPELKADSYRSGEFSGFDQPRLARHLMFISIERATGASRYVNGNWSEIERILPLIDRYVRAGGWAATVMGHYLTLCERARATYPAEAFADQVLDTLQEKDAKLKGWHGTWLPARIAGLVQHFADRDSPMPLGLAQKFLRILDLLVDMGDRRSAALQFAEAFREIRMA